MINIISHRAINPLYPENSLPSFEWAMEKGYGIELDIQLTQDEIPVISHDASIERMFTGKGNIQEYTLSELKTFSFKDNPYLSIPTFEEVCKLYTSIKSKNTFFCIHIKNMQERSVCKKTTELFKKYNLPKESFIFEIDDHSWPLIKYIKCTLPEMPVALHVPENSPNYCEERFRQADAIWVDEITNWFSKEMVMLAHDLGKKTYAISPELIPDSKYAKNYQQRWEDIISFDYDGICTDKAEELGEFLK